MHSPVSTQAFAHLRDASGPSPVLRMSMMPLMTATGSALTPPGPVTGQTSTHLPQRVQASAISATRATSAVSNVSVMRPRRAAKTSTQITAMHRRIEARPKSRRNRDSLHFDHHLGLGEALHGDGGAGGEILAEQFRAQ